MISIGAIFTALATAALAKGSIECSFSEPTGALQCFGAAGQLLIFHLPITANTDISLQKDDKYNILKIAKNQVVTSHEEYVSQSELFPNGTILLGNATKRHSGDYLLEEYGSNGVSLKKVNMHLEIQVPVSKPAVSQMCLPAEPQMDVSCSSEGDAVEFFWTLNGRSLWSPSNGIENTESPPGSKTRRDEPRVSSVVISLDGERTGSLTCRVWNNVSGDQTVIHLKSCRVSSFPVVAVVVTAGVISLLLLAALCLGLMKRNKPGPTAVDEGITEDEIVYADVKKTRKTGSKSRQNAT